MKEERAPSLVWFRRDLRLEDNPALAAAAARGPVVPVFVWSPEEEGASAPGAAARWWLRRSLESLDARLKERGLSLVVRKGPAASVLAALARETGAKAAAWSRVWEPALRLQEKSVAAALTGAGVEVLEQRANLLFEPDSVRTLDGRPYRVFTPFWARCAQSPAPPAPSGQTPALKPAAKRPKSVPLDELGLLPRIPWHLSLEKHFTPGEPAAREALRDFLRRGLADYRTARDFPAREGVSRLSPRLHFGELSALRVWKEASGGAGSPGEKGGFLSELGWRDFAAHVLHHFPETVAAPLDRKFESFRWRRDDEGLRSWRKGVTGFPIVDAGMRELWATGWMHNRVRMIVASFLAKDLLVDWREGAAWFTDTLVDADLASNTLGWQWAAGCGADAAPFFRVFNPSEQLKRWDPDLAYVRRWIPEYDLGYPEPILDHAEARARALVAFAEAGRRDARR